MKRRSSLTHRDNQESAIPGSAGDCRFLDFPIPLVNRPVGGGQTSNPDQTPVITS